MPAASAPRAARTPRVARRRHRLSPGYLAERAEGRDGPDLEVLEAFLDGVNAGERVDVQLLCFQWPNWPMLLGAPERGRPRVGIVDLFDALGLSRDDLLALFSPKNGPIIQGVFSPGGEEALATLLRAPIRVIRFVIQEGEMILLGATPTFQPTAPGT